MISGTVGEDRQVVIFGQKTKPSLWLCFKKNRGCIMTLVDLLMKLQVARSRSDARRLIAQGAVYVDGERVPPFWSDSDVSVKPGAHQLKVGKTRTMTVEFEDVKDET